MAFTTNEFARDAVGDPYYVRDITQDSAGRMQVTLTRLTDLLTQTQPDHVLEAAGFVPCQLIQERVGAFAKATKPMFRRNDWVWHRKSDGMYNIVGLPTEYVMEKTGEPAYVYMNNEGIRVVRSQKEMEDGRFQQASRAELDKRRLGTAFIPRY